MSPEQSAAMPSPFTPIADYAFLSNCHTGALIAPDGGVDWLCVPRFDSPSVFGSLLDREAGAFRLGPFAINHPASRVYEAGTNTLVTTWKTPNGWIVVRDALTMSPRQGEDTVTPHTRPPADDDADHLLVRVASCLDGEVVEGERPGGRGQGEDEGPDTDDDEDRKEGEGVDQDWDDLGGPGSAHPERARHRVASQRPDGMSLTEPGSVVVAVSPVEYLTVLTRRRAHRTPTRRRP